MLGHPTGRLLLGRPGYRVDLDRVIASAARHHKVLEINGSRHRLDLKALGAGREGEGSAFLRKPGRPFRQ